MTIELGLLLLLTQAPRQAPLTGPPPPSGSVGRSTFTSAVVNREPTDRLESPVASDTPVLFFTELRHLDGRAVSHVWRCQNGRSASIVFHVGGPRWRAWSQRPSTDCRRWNVRVEAEGAVLLVVTLETLPTVSIEVFRDLRYVESGFPMGLAAGQSPAAGLSEKPLEVLQAEPKYESAAVLYGYLPLGDGPDRRVTFVVDAVDRTSPQVWFDRNNNEDLTDDGGPILNQGTGAFAARVGVTVSGSARGPSETTRPYHVWMWLLTPSGTVAGPSAFRPLFYAVGHYAGRLTVAGESFDVIAFERRNYDAVFEDGDVCLDLDHDKTCSDPDEIVHDGQRLSIGGRPYRLRLKLN